MKKKAFWELFICIFIIIFIGTIAFLPFWKVEKINITNNDFYSDEYIMQKLKLKNGMRFSPIKVVLFERQLVSEEYISKVEAKYNFRDTLTLKITESNPIGCLPFANVYFYIDNNGHVIETNTESNYPIIEGLSYDKLQLKQTVSNEDSEKQKLLLEKLQKIRKISNSLIKHDFEKNIDSIDISNIHDIHLIVGDMDVVIGNVEDIDLKVSWLIEVLKQNTVGILDLTNVKNKIAVLKPLS